MELRTSGRRLAGGRGCVLIACIACRRQWWVGCPGGTLRSFFRCVVPGLIGYRVDHTRIKSAVPIFDFFFLPFVLVAVSLKPRACHARRTPRGSRRGHPRQCGICSPLHLCRATGIAPRMIAPPPRAGTRSRALSCLSSALRLFTGRPCHECLKMEKHEPKARRFPTHFPGPVYDSRLQF
jgi:hypothetical protein